MNFVVITLPICKRHRRRRIAALCTLLFAVVCLITSGALTRAQQTGPPGTAAQKPLDPAAWGASHVGKPVPEYIHGDECLFCHRNTVGATWQGNAHGVAVRQLEDAPQLRDLLKQPELSSAAEAIEYFMGSRHRVRFLKKDGYGKFAILNTQAVIDADSKPRGWVEKDKPAWDRDKFANRCAGCHATGIDAKAKTFSAFGLDCYVCHGDATLEHTKDISLMWLSKKKRSDAQAITSICAQCHLREGRSRSTGLPYPNNFIAGDNLFQDFAVDWAKADDEKLNPGDRHIYRNARDVAVYGKTYPTCINCHQVHAETEKQSIARHKLPPRAPICFDCHTNETPIKGVKPYTVTSGLCEY
ncbi:MAG TPA: multiheme c-type cytochrome [Blastocatellia bacterium]|nr:multiheme c-type cytochrome [Blastocatellia bacterium]